MTKRVRRQFSPSQKADLLRKHHVDKVPISELCNQNQLQPSVVYSWQHHKASSPDESLAQFGDYVIVHELLHFSVPNHGRLWKSLMSAHLGDHEKLVQELRQITKLS